MAYTLEAFVIQSAADDEAVKMFSSAVVVPLAQGISLIPLTDVFSVALAARYGAGPEIEFDDLSNLTGCAARWVAQVSHISPAAFLEAEFFGGHGSQAAISRQADQIAFGPLQASGAINQALHWLELCRLVN